MSEPQGSEPTQPWPPDQPTETPWWQKVRRHRTAATQHPAQPQEPPYQHGHHPQYVQQQPVYPGPHPPTPASPFNQPKRSKRWLLTIALVLLGVLLGLVVMAVAALIVFASSDRKQLDVAKAEAGVRQVLTDPTQGYGLENITDVKCNGGDNPTVKKDETFSCEVNVNGDKRQVAVVFIDDNGTYEVDRPR